jgi:hypothetical protein
VNKATRVAGIVVALAIAGCGSDGGAPADPAVEPTVEPPAFDLAAVKANFTDECKDPFVVDETFCEQVEISGMTADGEILNVPTTLAAEADDRGYAICDALAIAHFDLDGNDLGYSTIGILDRDGGNLAACNVNR